MLFKDNEGLQRLLEEEKTKVSLTLGEFGKYLAYTHNEGPDDVEREGVRTGIRKLKGTPVWTLLYPVRQVYHGMKFIDQNGFEGVYHKIEHAVKYNKKVRKREALAYLEQILPKEEERRRQKEEVFSSAPKISVLVPLYNTPEKYLRDMIESVVNQTYQNWELCLADASSEEFKNVGEIVREYASKDSRVVYEKLKKNAGIADNTNACIRMATGDYLALFDHDDMLHPSALYECAKVIDEKQADFIYTDEATFDGEELDNITTYHFKPDFSVDNLRGVNYICHLSVFRASLIEVVGMFQKEYDGSQDHDMIMRLTDAAKMVCHIPKILYFWRCHQMSTSMNLDSKSYAIAAGRHAVEDAEVRRGYPAKVYSAQICKTHYRMNYEFKALEVLIVIYGSQNWSRQIARTAAYVEKFSTYLNCRIHYANNTKDVEKAMLGFRGDYVAFLQGGIEIITPTWIEELLMFAQREDVGAVGMQILDEKGLILSSDIVLGNTKEKLVLEVNKGNRYDAPGYMGRNYYAHNVSALSGGAVMFDRDNLASLLPFEEEFTSPAGMMLDACIKLRSEGKQIVVNPYALCKIPEEDWRGSISKEDKEVLNNRYKEVLLKPDPFYNPNLSYEKFWQKG